MRSCLLLVLLVASLGGSMLHAISHRRRTDRLREVLVGHLQAALGAHGLTVANPAARHVGGKRISRSDAIEHQIADSHELMARQKSERVAAAM